MTDTLCQIFNIFEDVFFVVCFGGWCQWLFCHVAKRDSSPWKISFFIEVSFTRANSRVFSPFSRVKTPLYLSLRRSASQRRPISLFWYTYIKHKYDVTFLYDAHGAFIILFSRSRVWLSPSRTKNSKVASIFPRRRRRMPLTKIAGW
jgi:hypothetical protein